MTAEGIDEDITWLRDRQAPVDFADRVIAERQALAEADPAGEADAIHPIPPVIDPAAEQAAWEAGLAASLDRAGYDSIDAYVADMAMHSAEPDSRAAERMPLVFRTAREIAAETPARVRWVLGHYVARGALTELVGRAKAGGKSTLVAHALAALLDGRAFLGLPTMYGPVVLLTEQAGPSLRELLARASLLERDDLRILTWSEARGAAWPDVVAAALAVAQEIHAALLVVDTLPAFAGIRGDSENDSGAALEAIAPLQAAAASGLAVLVVRHERKGGGEVGESGRGSSAFSGAVDVVLRIARQENPVRPTVRVLAALSRFAETPDELVVELTDAGYVVLGDQAAVALAEARAGVLATIDAAPDGPTLDELYAELVPPARKTTIQDAVLALLEDGVIARTGRGRKGDPFRHVRPPGFIPPRSAESISRSDSGFVPAGASPVGGEPDPGGKDRTPPAEPPGLFEAAGLDDDDYPESAWATA